MPGSISRAPTGCGHSAAEHDRQGACDPSAQAPEVKENASTGRYRAYKGGSFRWRMHAWPKSRLSKQRVTEPTLSK